MAYLPISSDSEKCVLFGVGQILKHNYKENQEKYIKNTSKIKLNQMSQNIKTSELNKKRKSNNNNKIAHNRH